MPLCMAKFDSLCFFDAFMKTCEDIITLKDLNLNYLICNNNFFYLTGVPCDSPVNNKTVNDFLPDDVANIIERYCNLAIESRRTQIYNVKILSDSELKIYQVKSSPLIIDNIVTGVLSISRDVTAIELQEMQKEEFYESLFHDMKNTVQAQVKSLSMLSDGILGELTPQQKDIVDLTFDSCSELQNLLFSSLSFIKYDTELMTIDCSEFDVVGLIEKCIKDVYSLCYDKNIRISFNNSLSDEYMFYADKHKIRIVISNLLNNAINYAFKDTAIEIGLRMENNRLIFSFKNSSPKIPDSICKNIFQKYVSNTKPFKSLSSGIGLYLSKQIVEQHDGRIYLIASGTNNEFVFEIPQKRSDICNNFDS